LLSPQFDVSTSYWRGYSRMPVFRLQSRHFFHRSLHEQQALKALFQAIYLTQSDILCFSDLYHWPADFPPQTFLEPGRPKDLVTVQWASHHVQEDDEEESSGEETSPIVKTIREGDRRLGMPVFSIVEERNGSLDSIEVSADGCERWIALGDDGKQMVDESSLFWLETSQYRHLFPTRVLDQDAIAQQLHEALALYEEKAELSDHDEIIQFHQRLDSLLTFLNGDLEDEPKERIAQVYHQMLWGCPSLKAEQRETVVQQTAAEISRLRENRV
jgi:hypothetical protein